MATGKHRPSNDKYWQKAWSKSLFQGDLFQAIPFGDQPTVVVESLDQKGKHYIGEIAFGYGLLITPTCDMTLHTEPEQTAHSYRVLVPLIPLEAVEPIIGSNNVNLIRSRDKLVPYMYLPPNEEVDSESVACLYRPTLVSDDLLREPPRRVAQLGPEARRHLKIKLAAYWVRVSVEPADLPLHERLEEDEQSTTEPPSSYDSATSLD